MTFDIDTHGMTDLGYRLFLDRYALKKLDVQSLKSDRLVLVKVDDIGHKEIAKVALTSDVGDPVDLILQDGTMIYDVPLDHMDVPIEYDPKQMFNRVASAAASAEKDHLVDEWTVKFRDLLNDWKFVPAGRILASAGTDSALTYYNCYVLPSPVDSKSGIFNALKRMSYIMASGGGVGINMSTIRPRHARTYSTNGRSSGAVSWGELYSYTTGLIDQGSRRGALMIILDVWHPDIGELISVKKDMSRYNNANISIGISDYFMKAVENNEDWNLVFPDTTIPHYDKVWNGNIKNWQSSLKVYKTVKARDLWDQIIDAAWSSAEPGLVFIDQANKQSNSYYYNELIATNPCGEVPLPANGVCLLGSLNLSEFVFVDGKGGNVNRNGLNYDKLGETIKTAVRFLDNIIDVTPYQYEENEKQQKSERRIGLGTMGLAEVLIKLGLRYGSGKSLKFIDNLYKFIAETAYNASIDLADEKGSFPEFDKEEYMNLPFILNLNVTTVNRIYGLGIRNVTILSQAPTGTIGTMVDTSTGIEPYYAWEYMRTTRLGNYHQRVKPCQEWCDKFAAHGGNPDFPAIMPNYFVTAMEISPGDHVRVLATVQKWTDSAVSKTCNLPNSATRDDISKIYNMMYALGCKGGTVYRDGSRDVQVLNVETKEDTDIEDIRTIYENLKKRNTELEDEFEEGDSRMDNSDLPDDHGKGMPKEHPVVERDQILHGTTFRIRNSFGNCFVTINSDSDGNPFEVFINVGKAGSDIQADAEAIGRLISLILRLSSDISQSDRLKEVYGQLRGIGSGKSYGFGQDRVSSIPDSIGRALEMFHHKKESDKQHFTEDLEKLKSMLEDAEDNKFSELDKLTTAGFSEEKETLGDACPECKNFTFIRIEGCKKCEFCGYSEC